MSLESCPFIIDHGFSLLNLVHVVLHLVIEVTLEETEQVLLDVNLLDLTVDRFQLRVDLRCLDLAQTTHFSPHLGNLILFKVLSVLFRLLLDLLNDLWSDQIQLKIDSQEASVLFDQ